jgi:hypothetical protein
MASRATRWLKPLSKAYGGSTWMGSFVNLVGLAGLIASFFSIIYAYSRQIFALSRAGYLPRKLSETNKSKAPVLALIIPGIIGFGLSLTGQGDLLILVAVFGATISYVLMMAAHITLRIRRPKMERPYRTPGGIFTSGTGFGAGLCGRGGGLPGGPARGDWRGDDLWSINCLLRFLQSASLGSRYAGRGIRGYSTGRRGRLALTAEIRADLRVARHGAPKWQVFPMRLAPRPTVSTALKT